jgi:hypothetical protein
MSCDVLVADGLLSADAQEPLAGLLDAALSHGVHLGTLEARHATLADALRAADPVLCHRVVRAETVGPRGWLASPLAPRSAVGPDLSCFALGTRNRVTRVVLRVEPFTGFVRQRVTTLREGMSLARTLVERGCSLVVLAPDGTLTAALPRPGAGRGFSSAVTPAATDLRVVQSKWAAWDDVATLCQDFGPLQVHALDTHGVALSVVDGPARLPPQHGTFPDDIVAAFDLEDRRV